MGDFEWICDFSMKAKVEKFKKTSLSLANVCVVVISPSIIPCRACNDFFFDPRSQKI